MRPQPSIGTAIASTLVVLADRLTTASLTAWSAWDAARAGNRNLAIGTIVPLTDELADLVALSTAIAALLRKGQGGAS